jgi:hypothetical protein
MFMLSYEIYKWVHYVGIFILFLSFGAVAASDTRRKWVSALHGIALLLLLVAGFGMIARLKIMWPWPSWLLIKIVIWFLLGGVLVVGRKRLIPVSYFLILVTALGAISAYAALFKPFVPLS